jgi:hypothetical protein
VMTKVRSEREDWREVQREKLSRRTEVSENWR